MSSSVHSLPTYEVHAGLPIYRELPANPPIPAISATTPKWYALHTKSRSEQSVSEILRWNDVESYLPLRTERRRLCDRWKEFQMPLFPGYVFCHIPLDHPFRIVSTPGVISFVGVARYPVAIPDEEIDAIRRLLASGRSIRPMAAFHDGQKVHIRSGALQGLEGRILKVKNENLLVVTVELLQRSVSVSLEGDCVESV